MINSVVSSVCSAIYDAFGDDYCIYKEFVQQNFVEPCFFVDCIIPLRTRCLNNRFYRQHAFCIRYFPSTADYRSECHDVLEKLRVALDYISLDGNLIPAKNWNCEFSDSKTLTYEISKTIMQVFVDFDFFTIETGDPVTLMGELIVKS